MTQPQPAEDGAAYRYRYIGYRPAQARGPFRDFDSLSFASLPWAVVHGPRGALWATGRALRVETAVVLGRARGRASPRVEVPDVRTGSWIDNRILDRLKVKTAVRSHRNRLKALLELEVKHQSTVRLQALVSHDTVCEPTMYIPTVLSLSCVRARRSAPKRRCSLSLSCSRLASSQGVQSRLSNAWVQSYSLGRHEL